MNGVLIIRRIHGSELVDFEKWSNESEDLLLRKTQNVPFMFYQTLNLSKTISRISRIF
jgi:hypothetical protein